MTVLRVRTRETLMRPDVASLVMRAAAACKLRSSSGAVMAQLARDIAAEHIGCFVSFAHDEPNGILVAELPTSVFQLGPVVVVAYSEGIGRALALEAARRLRAWLGEAGFHYAIGLNLLHTDRTFTRGFAYFGTSRRIGSVIKFDL